MATNHDKVSEQFSPAAQDYLVSAVHAQGADLDQLAALAPGLRARNALDLGCGAGHVSFTVAPHVGHVTAYDLSRAMLDVVAQAARERGMDNIISVQEGVAEKLPYADASFDLVCSRYSAHHWADVPMALKEIRRVLMRGGKLVMMDIASFDVPVHDTHLQAIELLRDPSHVRDYTALEWREMMTVAGFEVDALRCWRIKLEFSSWIARMRTPAVHVDAIRSLLGNASEDVRTSLQVEEDGSFHPQTLFIEAQ